MAVDLSVLIVLVSFVVIIFVERVLSRSVVAVVDTLVLGLHRSSEAKQKDSLNSKPGEELAAIWGFCIFHSTFHIYFLTVPEYEILTD